MLWLIGALGFALRGGIVLLTLPIVVLPTPVEVRLMLGASIGSTGLTVDFWTTVVIAASSCAVLLAVVLLALARLEMAAFDRFVRDPEVDDVRAWRRLPSSRAVRRRHMLGWLFVVQGLGVLALGLAALPLASAIGPAILDEVLRPSSTDGIYLRVLERVLPQIGLLAIGIVAVEMFAALAARYVLLRGYGLSSPSSRSRRMLLGAPLFAVTRFLSAPVTTLATAAVGWLVAAVVLVPGIWALTAVWQTTRAAFLATTSVGDLLAHPEALIVAVLLAAVLLVALALGGLASALRGAFWSMEAVRRATDEGR